MRRVREVIFASSLTSSAMVALALAAAASSPAAAAPRAAASPAPASAAAAPPCLPRGARSLASDRAAVVFSWHASVYGCLFATGQRRKLGSADVCIGPSGSVAPVRLAGRIVAYGLERCGVDTGSSTVIVLDLASGTRRADLPAETLQIGPESYYSVQALVLRADGAVAWIAHDGSIVRHLQTYEVHRFAGGKSSLLDSGAAIDPRSLRLAGSRLTWRDGRKTRSASLA